jgi:2'-5' RNA ligase
VELAPRKRQLLTQQHDERAVLLAALEQLQSEYHKELEQIRRQVRKKTFTREITRARRYHEEKSFWEYVNNLVEDIHVYTWRKMVVVSCTDTYQRRRYLLEQELRDQQALHRKERITLRYDSPSEV